MPQTRNQSPPMKSGPVRCKKARLGSCVNDVFRFLPCCYCSLLSHIPTPYYFVLFLSSTHTLSLSLSLPCTPCLALCNPLFISVFFSHPFFFFFSFPSPPL